MCGRQLMAMLQAGYGIDCLGALSGRNVLVGAAVVPYFPPMPDALAKLFLTPSPAQAILTLGLIIAIGGAIGRISIRGISLGIAGVLFAGLFAAHLGFTVDSHILEFAREFGLILFVYTIGLQVGPGFLSSLKKQGLRLNLLAAGIVLLGTVIAVVIARLAQLPVDVMAGLLSGAVTNTPSLGAAQQVIAEHNGTGAGTGAGMGYAMTYPFGIIGTILTMLIIRSCCRIDSRQELETTSGATTQGDLPANHNLVVMNPGLAGQSVPTLAAALKVDFVVSRLLRGERVLIPDARTVLQLGDVLHVVCSEDNAARLAMLVGDESRVDVRDVPSQLTSRHIVVTRNDKVGKTIRELDLIHRYGVAVTRVNRAGIELVANAGMELWLGDRITLVGSKAAIETVAVELGNSVKQLNHPNILPIFVGIILGVLLGSIPIVLPGIPAPVKLGLAGGPLIVAMVLSRQSRLGPLIWYMPPGANLVLREMGIALFLACVGLRSGGAFAETLMEGDGFRWMVYGAAITLIPLLLIGFVARIIFRVNYASLCGLLAGGMTDPPALSFANNITGSDTPAVTYATVYPLVMFLRIVTAQILVLLPLMLGTPRVSPPRHNPDPLPVAAPAAAVVPPSPLPIPSTPTPEVSLPRAPAPAAQPSIVSVPAAVTEKPRGAAPGTTPRAMRDLGYRQEELADRRARKEKVLEALERSLAEVGSDEERSAIETAIERVKDQLARMSLQHSAASDELQVIHDGQKPTPP